jgi:hypothetical protein
MATWVPAALGVVVLAVPGVLQARPAGVPAMALAALPGAAAIVLGLAVVRPLWRRRREFSSKPKPP